MHNHDWSVVTLMIAQLVVAVIMNRGLVLITLALDTTDATTNSNSILPVLPGSASLVNAVEARRLLLLTMMTDGGTG